METGTLKQLAEESLWYLGFGLIVVFIFVGIQINRYRQRKMSKRPMTAESLKLWQEVQKKRGL